MLQTLKTRQDFNFVSLFLGRGFIVTPVALAKPKKMGPKKKEEIPKILLGRPGNNLKAGIVGLANVGKSTFFQVSFTVSKPFAYTNGTIGNHEINFG